MQKALLPTAGWNWNAMWRGRFDLSIDNPLAMLHKVHSNPEDALFDMHYELEIGIVCTGRMIRRYLDWNVELGPGDIWLCGVWEPHGFHIRRCPCEVVVLVVSPEYLRDAHPGRVDWLKPFSVAPQDRPHIANSASRREIIRIARRILKSESDGTARKTAWLSALSTEILLLVTEQWSVPDSDIGPQSAGVYGRIAPSLRLAMGTHTLVTEKSAAEACSMSRNIFCGHFKRLMGISFAQFALRNRLREVARQLGTTDAPLKAVAADWGFTDVSHLHRTFRRHYGCSPRTYRETVVDKVA